MRGEIEEWPLDFNSFSAPLSNLIKKKKKHAIKGDNQVGKLNSICRNFESGMELTVFFFGSLFVRNPFPFRLSHVSCFLHKIFIFSDLLKINILY